MASDESDDEPLAIIAAAKKLCPEKYADETASATNEPAKKKKKKIIPTKRLTAMTIKINRALKAVITPPVVERPMDVWLYLKDLNPTGPYSCLLCSNWFINRGKMIVHYMLNHKKDYCGICRYFVPDRESWYAHLKFHVPWPCSQCVKNFETEAELRQHFSAEHNLVHCRLCHFRVADDDQYNTHLIQKHTVSNLSCKNDEDLWEFEYEGSNHFLCLLCSKSNNPCNMFFNHYMGYHHSTLKCLSTMLSGRDLPFSVNGADVSPAFIDGILKDHGRYGYVDLEHKPPQTKQEEDPSDNETDLLSVLIPEIKQEVSSEPEEAVDEKTKEKKKKVRDENDIANIYKGDEDFDVTLTELIILQKCYVEYVNQTLNDINSNLVPEVSNIDYTTAKPDLLTIDIPCSLCKSKHNNVQSLVSHMIKNHLVKTAPIYSCRVCATTFENQGELDSHVKEELGDFEDLWLCQFCDKEFDNREATRRHLTEHWELMEFDNCFSPHLGFKCKFCPTLFWNEIDREAHQVRVHFNQHKDQFYKCDDCSETFSDKIFYIHHYMEKHHSAESPTYLIKCSMCCVVRSSLEDMRRHFEGSHPEARKVFCSLDSCQYRPLSHRKSFKFHLRNVHDPTARPARSVSCTVCGREFGSSRACGAHMAVHGSGKFKCKLCKEMLHTLDERKLHYLICHPGRHPFECSECGKSFQYKSSLYMHKQEHSPNKQSYTCSYCSKQFAKRDSFREHLQIHEGPRHACSYCPMRFVQRSNMLRHERRHTGERPYACAHCPRTFADKGACNSHSRTHSKEASYACVYCGQTFVQKSKLTYHIRKHTGENLETCPVCSKLFTSGFSLREHMKIHQAKKKEAVQCPLCDKKYQDERYMLRHLRTSHTRTQQSCPLCDKTLTSMAGLRHHVITHSGLNTFRCKCCPKSYAAKRSMVRHLKKRHSLKSSEISIKDYFKRIDPWDCKLDLDDETMRRIFGPQKKTANDLLIGDFVTFTKKLTFAENLQSKNDGDENEDDDDDDDENDEDGNDEDGDDEDGNDVDVGNKHSDDGNDNPSTEKANEIQQVIIKIEKPDSDEVEPTDFVSVKIEPMEEDDEIS